MFRVLSDDEARQVRRWQAPELDARSNNTSSTTISEISGHRRDIGDVASNTQPDSMDLLSTETSPDPLRQTGTNGGDGSGDIMDSGQRTPMSNASAAMLQMSYDEGYAKGYATGSSEAHAQSGQELSSILAQLTQSQQLQNQQLLSELAELARVMAGLILHRQIDQDVSILDDWIQAGLQRLPQSSVTPIVRLHPLDVVRLKLHLDPEQAALLVEDANLKRGDCILESAHSVLRTGVAEQLDRLIDDLEIYTESQSQS